MSKWLLTLCLLLPVPAGAQTVAIHAGKLIDTDSGTLLSNQTILIRGNKIEAVGSNIAIPADAKIIDLTKMTVLPGLIDCHTHLDTGAYDSNDMYIFTKTSAELALESVPNARAMLESGFTTVRDVGTLRALGDIALRDVAGAYVTITGGAGAATGLAPDITLPWLEWGCARS
jgi:imidazolonepropionase-like amidohydrolase